MFFSSFLGVSLGCSRFSEGIRHVRKRCLDPGSEVGRSRRRRGNRLTIGFEIGLKFSDESSGIGSDTIGHFGPGSSYVVSGVLPGIGYVAYGRFPEVVCEMHQIVPGLSHGRPEKVYSFDHSVYHVLDRGHCACSDKHHSSDHGIGCGLEYRKQHLSSPDDASNQD